MCGDEFRMRVADAMRSYADTLDAAGADVDVDATMVMLSAFSYAGAWAPLPGEYPMDTASLVRMVADLVDPTCRPRLEVTTGESEDGAVLRFSGHTVCGECGVPIGPIDRYCRNCGCRVVR